MACHHMDLSYWALGLRYPATVEAFCDAKPTQEIAPANLRVEYTYTARTRRRQREGTPPPFEGKLTWYDGDLRPPLLKEKGLPDWGAGTLFVGEKGMLQADYNQRMLFPQEKFADYKAPEPTIPKSAGHHREWINACQTGSPPTCNFNYSGVLAEAVLLGAVAFRVGKKLEWDARNMRATNCPEADQYLSRPYRKGWEV